MKVMFTEIAPPGPIEGTRPEMVFELIANVPDEAVAFNTTVPTGNISFQTTSVAVFGPLFVRVTTAVILLPTIYGGAL